MDSGTLAWGITAAALVLFMTPGVAFFYGGLVKAKSVVSMMMMSFGAMALIGVLWILYGFNMTAVTDPWAFAGNPFSNFALSFPQLAGSDFVLALFGSTFAIITVALISGAIADRAKFGSWMIFAGIWATIVYFPVAAWVWGGGWIMNLGTALFGEESGLFVLDYAGGTAVHINAGAAALALALVLGKRIGFQKGIQKPHNVPLTLLGASILWFGWFGFNAGAEANWANGDGTYGFMGPDSAAGLIVINTLGATAAAIAGWLIIEKLKDGKPTSVGAASGAVAGLVAITPACAFLTPGWALLLGVLAGALCALAVELKWKLGFDDSLDVVGIHLVGGLFGTLYLGFFATGTGLFLGGGAGQLAIQAIAAIAVLAYSFAVAWILGFAIEKTIGFRIKNEDELAGVDTVVHGEEGYLIDERA
ncbi:Amt family ammonium transporter [Microbacterium terrae]|uniref:Ammonium transporter n=1 Tax=Microbacterium terrae TaxID=69369 RepID=A0A0M2H1J7_9MICO|nr:ammonium transporter [Microbacterium terrae]KJL37938.1 Ammonia channel precursor [Microbacterium terrae]MBP1077347.1 Amt family ammonium transporter [Microbacterium terrae]GLJ98958.1 ammonium transporter [Microbacterium terrae]